MDLKMSSLICIASTCRLQSNPYQDQLLLQFVAQEPYPTDNTKQYHILLLAIVIMNLVTQRKLLIVDM